LWQYFQKARLVSRLRERPVQEMSGTRQKIIGILQEQGPATVRELAEAVDLTPMSVRHHLQSLREEGIVTTSGLTAPDGVGRPQKIYELTVESDFKARLDFGLLLHSLLSETRSFLGDERFRQLLLSIVDRILTEECPRLEGLSREKRIREVTAYLSRRGHLARWELVDGGFLLHAYNCPFHPLGNLYPDLCELDLRLVGGLVGEPVEQTASILQCQGRCTYHLLAQRRAGPKGPGQAG
jgi:DeoR family transcriptional regulator, suf operon transcriptional repressor